MISLVQASTATPENKVSTTELVASMMHKLSPELINSICSLGVENRYSAMENYGDFLGGAPAHMTSSTTDLGVDATRKCIEEWGGDPRRLVCWLQATNTPDQMLPCLASEVMGRTHGLLPRSMSTVSMQSQGCSVMLKSVEVAQWYLAANPGKMAIVLMSEAHTPFVAPWFVTNTGASAKSLACAKATSSPMPSSNNSALKPPWRFNQCCSVTAPWRCSSARTFPASRHSDQSRT
jgi:3-oxoacyl-[acyl-carrier-protein] synthase III